MAEPQSLHANSTQQTDHASPWRVWSVLFAVAFVLYAATANRGAQWQDSGFHILRVVTGESVHPLGLALSHPLHHWLGRFVASWDLFQPCFAVTLVSALAAAVAVANVYGCVLTLTRRQTAALLAAGSLGLAHTFWQMATLAETYTLVAALLSAECWCLAAYASTRRRGYLWAMVLFNGLGISNHLLASLTTPVLVFVVLQAVWKREVRLGDVGIGLGLWLLGSIPYIALVAAEMARTGEALETLRSALFGQSFSDEVLNTTLSPGMLLIGVGFVVLNFPNLLLPAAAYGLVRAGRCGVPGLARRALLAGLVIHLCFVARYNIVDQHTFFLPAYVLLSIFGGVGFAMMLRWQRRQTRGVGLMTAVATLALTPILYTLVPAVVRRFDVLSDVQRNKPYRDDYVYIFTPWSVVERSAERMSRQAVELAGDRGLILVEDPMAEFAIRYQAIRAGADDVQIISEVNPETIADAVDQGRPIVLVPARANAPRTVPPAGLWKRVGDLYVLTSGTSD